MTTRFAALLALAALAAPAAAQTAAMLDTGDNGMQTAQNDAGAGDDATAPAAAEDADTLPIFPAEEVTLDEFRWISRPIVVFADTPADPRYQEQMELLAREPELLVERDVVIITDTAPDTLSDARERLRPRGFMLALLAKDGTVNLRKPFPWDIREITRAIDKMPMRQEELRRQ
ncbi:DUF4174 domain-containing protein [Rhodovulum sp. YNF3179]|uniref:DUF4174 domain-containing protein n=1 Tax=Rhodovulum sp. YNF3179 TaxID=3425127 RepID=UPI003D345452